MKKNGCNGGYRGQGDCEWEGSFDTEDDGFLPFSFFFEGPLVIIYSVFLHIEDRYLAGSICSREITLRLMDMDILLAWSLSE